MIPLAETGKDHEALLARALGAPDSEQVAARVVTKEASKTVSLSLPGDLAPVSYAVVWRALSVDTYTKQDLTVFHLPTLDASFALAKPASGKCPDYSDPAVAGRVRCSCPSPPRNVKKGFRA